MCERVKAIKEYYYKLGYNESNREEALTKITNLPKEIKYDEMNNSYSSRLFETASVIKKNILLFQTVCDHVDIVTTLIEYLTNFGIKLKYSNFSDQEVTDEVTSVIYTLFNVCMQNEVQLFLKDAIINGGKLAPFIEIVRCKILSIGQVNEMIVLEDSDLYAVISYLMIRENSSFNKIWVQQPIRQKFISLLKKYSNLQEFSIHTFRSKQELLTASQEDPRECLRIKFKQISITSIWSEDIIAAKSLATSLNKDVIFINTHMDLYGGNVLLPYKWPKIQNNCLVYIKISKPKLDQNQCANVKPNAHKGLTYNLFFDGMWQKPIKNTYWIYKNILWANATSDDIERCLNSAEKGAKIWSTKSIDSRKQILSKFAFMLKCNGKSQLAKLVSKWIEYLYLHENPLFCPPSERLEITTIRRPYGIIVLKADQETSLFSRLIQALIAGNSVITICSAITSLAPYCDMFSTSGIPPGVINMLLKEDPEDDILEKLSYRKFEQLFTEDEPEKMYINLTLSKKIIVPLK